MDPDRDPTERAAATCPGCGARFGCGAAAGAESCWCFERPPVAIPAELAAAGTCLCPACLDRLAAPPPETPNPGA
jgi:hypothetical protein